MTQFDQEISQLEARLESLVRTQIDFQVEVTAIRKELSRLRGAARAAEPVPESVEPAIKQEPAFTEPEPAWEPLPPRPTIYDQPADPPNFGHAYRGSVTDEAPRESAFGRSFERYTESARADLEKFIGENLISKIGILILIIGVGIGVKYSIDNNLISPLTRIILGYLFGFGLIGLAAKLKSKYHNFSAVLVSGGMAILYFVTYFGYSLYGLIGREAAFGLMAMFTIFTVSTALIYNRQVIAHIGLVGAYAVPFLLSSNSGNYAALFGYMSIIDLGILAVSVKKNWHPLYYTSAGFTWLIFTAWFADRYEASQNLHLALGFLLMFSAIFFAARVVYDTVHGTANEIVRKVNAVALGVVLYAFCLAISSGSLETRDHWLVFSYVAGGTLAILWLAFRYFGKALIYVAFVAVWLIFGSWYGGEYRPEEHFTMAAIFASLFFGVFYAVFIYMRVTERLTSLVEVSTTFLSNAFIFYGFGYSLLDGHLHLSPYLGLFTVAHAALHGGVALAVNRLRSNAVDVIQLLTILILTFASISIPVQFNGNFVTMIWAMEAALLFWFGRFKGVRLFEYYSLPVMALGAGSMLLDWAAYYSDRAVTLGSSIHRPLANGDFITAAVVVFAFIFIFFANRDEDLEPGIPKDWVQPLGFIAGGIAIFVLWNMFRTEIDNFFFGRLAAAIASNDVFGPIYKVFSLKSQIWQIDYTLGFLAALGFYNLRWMRSWLLGGIVSALSVLLLVGFLLGVLVPFAELNDIYLASGGVGLVAIRYPSYLLAGAALYVLFLYSKWEAFDELLPERARRLAFEGIAYSFAFIVTSAELVFLMDQWHLPDATKLGLTIWWGIYSLMLIIVGIARDKKHLRIAAIVLLAVTLTKLFFYDIAGLGTIAKTVLFLIVGATFLAISFLYNKYKDVIFGSSPTEGDEFVQGDGEL